MNKRVVSILMFAAAVAVAGQLATRAPACRLVAYDTHGAAFVAGAGDTPAEALDGMVLPPDLDTVEMICGKGRGK